MICNIKQTEETFVWLLDKLIGGSTNTWGIGPSVSA